MALALLTVSCVLFRCISASPHQSFHRTNGYCKELNIPVVATAPSNIYDLPRVNNDIDATAWAIYDSTRNTPKAFESVLKNTTTSGTFNIHAQLCIPKSSSKRDILQIATHGLHYDSRYWDSRYQPEKHSYVEATLKAGYSILTYDRLGHGQSDHPDAYEVVQAPLHLEILRQLTLMARNGTLYNLAGQAKPSIPAFSAVSKASKVVHVGHSYGSFVTTALIARYGNLSDGAIITGFILSEFIGKSGVVAFAVEYAGRPPFNRPSGYVVSNKIGIQTVFFNGKPGTAFTPELLNYGDAIKQPIALGELQSAFLIVGGSGPASQFRGPVQYLLAELDFYICQGDCKGLADMNVLNQSYPNAAAIEVAIQPNTGHALPLHNNATAGFQLKYDFLVRNGL
jgi:pimeloyl-ACP methyl ester carboxylesterase